MTKKRYVGLDEDGKLHATGLEMKRTDWTNLAQNVQETLLKMILINEATEEQINEYMSHIKRHIKEFPVEDFIFEKIIDCRKEVKAHTRIIKAWESFGYKVEVTEYEEDGRKKKKYQCIAPRGEVLMGIRWIYDNKGSPIGIPESDPTILYKDKIGYDWYINNQVIPIAERVTRSVSYRLGSKQTDLFGEVIYV
jgi:DNA polymerase elongation subunit (family B)